MQLWWTGTAGLIFSFLTIKKSSFILTFLTSLYSNGIIFQRSKRGKKFTNSIKSVIKTEAAIIVLALDTC